MGARLIERLLRGVRVGGRIEEKNRKAWGAPGSEVERDVAGEQQDGVAGRNLGVGGADEVFKVRNPRAGGGESAKCWKGCIHLRAIEMNVAQALVAGGIE